MARQKADFIRLGVLGDWDNPYLTMDHSIEAGIIRAFGKIHRSGYLYQGQKPVNWCIDCGSALAEAEVEYEDKTSSAIDVGFEVVDSNSQVDSNPSHPLAAAFGISTPKNTAVYAVIWTTTPWTLPANQAVAVHPDFDYALIETPRGLLILAADLAQTCLERYGLHGKMLATCKGSALESIPLSHPFNGQMVPIICGEHVTLEAGTGLVHTAPAHGLDDYFVRSEIWPFRLIARLMTMANSFLHRRCWRPFVWKANDVVIDTLGKNGHLLHMEKFSIATRTAGVTGPRLFFGPRRSGLSVWTRRADKQFSTGKNVAGTGRGCVEATRFYPSGVRLVWKR